MPVPIFTSETLFPTEMYSAFSEKLTHLRYRAHMSPPAFPAKRQVLSNIVEHADPFVVSLALLYDLMERNEAAYQHDVEQFVGDVVSDDYTADLAAPIYKTRQ